MTLDHSTLPVCCISTRLTQLMRRALRKDPRRVCSSQTDGFVPDGDEYRRMGQVPPVDTTAPLYQYQRLEDEGFFVPMGKPIACALMSEDECLRDQAHHAYTNNHSNRILLSPALVGLLDRNAIKLSVVSVSIAPVVGDRFHVKLKITVGPHVSGDYIAWRLKKTVELNERATVAVTSVLVVNPHIFSECVEWRERVTDAHWRAAGEGAVGADQAPSRSVIRVWVSKCSHL